MKTPTTSCKNSLTDLPIPSGTETAKAVKKKPGAKASHSRKEDSNDSFLRSLPNDGHRDSQSYPDNSKNSHQAVKKAHHGHRDSFSNPDNSKNSHQAVKKAHNAHRDSFSYPENSEDPNQVKAVKKAPGSRNANHAVKKTPGSENTKVANESRRDSKVSKASQHATKNSIGDKQEDEKVENQPPKTHDNLPFETDKEPFGLFDHEEKDVTNPKFHKIFNPQTHAHRLFPITNEPALDVQSQDDNVFFNLFPNSATAATHDFYFGVPSLATVKCGKVKRRVYNPLGSEFTAIVPNLHGEMKCGSKLGSHRFYKRSNIDYLWKHYGCQYDDDKYDGKLLVKVGLEEEEKEAEESGSEADSVAENQGSADEDDKFSEYSVMEKHETNHHRASNDSSGNRTSENNPYGAKTNSDDHKAVKKTAATKNHRTTRDSAATRNDSHITGHAGQGSGARAVKKKKTNGHRTTRDDVLSDEYFHDRNSREFDFEGAGTNSGNKGVKKKGPRPSSGPPPDAQLNFCKSPFPSGMDSDGFHSGGHPKKKTHETHNDHNEQTSLKSDSLASTQKRTNETHHYRSNETHHHNSHNQQTSLKSDSLTYHNRRKNETHHFDSHNHQTNNSLKSDSFASSKINSARSYSTHVSSINSKSVHSNYSSIYPDNKTNKETNVFNSAYPTNSLSNNDLDSNIANYKRNLLNFRHSQRIDVIDYVSLSNNCSNSGYNKAFPKNKPARPLKMRMATYPSKKRMFNPDPEENNVFVDHFMGQDEFTKDFSCSSKKTPLISDLMNFENDQIKEKVEKSVFAIMKTGKDNELGKKTEVNSNENNLLHTSTDSKILSNTTSEKTTGFEDASDITKNTIPEKTENVPKKKIFRKKDLKCFQNNIKIMTVEVEKIANKLKDKNGLSEIKTETDQLINNLNTVNDWVGNQIESSPSNSRTRGISFDENMK